MNCDIAVGLTKTGFVGGLSGHQCIFTNGLVCKSYCYNLQTPQSVILVVRTQFLQLAFLFAIFTAEIFIASFFVAIIEEIWTKVCFINCVYCLPV